MSLDVDAIVLNVYRARLDAVCQGDADSQLAKDNDGGAKQKRRAEFYRPVVVEALVQAGVYQRPVRVPVRRAAE